MADPAESDSEEQDTLVQWAMSNAVKPINFLTSRSAVKAYLSTLLFFITSIGLLALSTTAYAFFYYNYIPQINLERTVYLQYGLGTHPYATLPLDTTSLISQQAYDVEVILHMPRTPPNLAAGNFMLDLSLLAQGALRPPVNLPDSASQLLSNLTAGHTILHHSRRPAILPYASPILSLSHTILHLPWHLLSFRDLDSSTLVIPMFEMLSFARGTRNIPTHVRLELQSTQPSPSMLPNLNPPTSTELQVYTTKIAFRARFQGIRYIIYNYRILAFLIFTAVFYVVSLASMAAAWATILTFFSTASSKPGAIKREPESDRKRIKQEDATATASGDGSNGHAKGAAPSTSRTAAGIKTEEEEEDDDDDGLSLSNLSDTPANFPSGRGQMPLRFAGRNTITTGPGRTEVGEQADQQPGVKTEDAAAADDEDEDEDGDKGERENRHGQKAETRRYEGDSGIGTSMESENVTAGASGGLTRRRSGRGSSGGGGGAAGGAGPSSGGRGA